MATRTLAQFRAEHNIWRKDLAELLGITEGELERLELTGEVPEAVMQKLTESYALPETYFTEDVDYARAVEAAAQRKTPKKPLAYFVKVSFVWQLLVVLVISLVTTPSTVSAALDYTVSPFFSTLESFCTLLITAFSGIYLGSYLIKKTNFRGNIADFEFLYPFLPSIACTWVSTLIMRVFFVSAENAEGFMPIMLPAVITGLLALVLQTAYLSFLLDAAALADGAEKEKRLKILCGVALGGQILVYIIIAAFGDFKDATAILWVKHALNLLLLLAVLYGVLFGAKKRPRLKKLWYTVLPLLASLLPSSITLIADLVS